MNHADARPIIVAAFERRFSRPPSRPEAQCVQAIGDLESSYGRGWKPPGVGSHNWGAIQAHGWPGDVFSYTDTKPNADGTSTPYRISFRAYPSDAAGAEDLVRTVYQADFPGEARDRVLLVLPSAQAGDLLGFSAGLHASGYYEGFGKTVEDRIANHHRAVLRSVIGQCHAIGEPMPDGSAPPAKPRRTLSLRTPPMVGGEVVELRRVLQTDKPSSYMPSGWDPNSGAFDSDVRLLLIEWQANNGLEPDGICGPLTWEAMGPWLEDTKPDGRA